MCLEVTTGYKVEKIKGIFLVFHLGKKGDKIMPEPLEQFIKGTFRQVKTFFMVLFLI